MALISAILNARKRRFLPAFGPSRLTPRGRLGPLHAQTRNVQTRGSLTLAFAGAANTLVGWRDAGVFFVVFVSLWAMCLVTEGVVLSLGVLAGANNLKVFWVATGSITAEVV